MIGGRRLAPNSAPSECVTMLSPLGHGDRGHRVPRSPAVRSTEGKCMLWVTSFADRTCVKGSRWESGGPGGARNRPVTPPNGVAFPPVMSGFMAVSSGQSSRRRLAARLAVSPRKTGSSDASWAAGPAYTTFACRERTAQPHDIAIICRGSTQRKQENNAPHMSKSSPPEASPTAVPAQPISVHNLSAMLSWSSL